MQHWIWLMITLATLFIEVVTLGNLVTIWFSIGAFFAWIASLVNLPTFVQVGVFIIVSALALVLIRPLARSYLRGNIIPTNADRLIGQITTLTKAISSVQWGEAVVFGQTWSVVEKNNTLLQQGALVKIIAIEGAKLIVEPVTLKED